jgi:hypothetical protein
VTTATPVIADRPLTATDRCDRCGAQAYVRAVLGSDSELLFCAHHWHANADALRAIATDVYEELDRLAAVPATASAEER